MCAGARANSAERPSLVLVRILPVGHILKLASPLSLNLPNRPRLCSRVTLGAFAVCNISEPPRSCKSRPWWRELIKSLLFLKAQDAY